MVKWTSWIVYISNNEGELIGWQWKSVEGESVDLWGVSILKEEDTLQKPFLHLCLSGEAPSLFRLKWNNSERNG